MMNKQKGNMYNFVTHTWNPIKGECIHDCSYCYMKQFPQKEIRLNEKCFKDDLGTGNTIFVGSSTDMFAENISDNWITEVLIYCSHFYNNYLFQSKNPKRFLSEKYFFPQPTILATTIESDIHWQPGITPSPQSRIMAMEKLKEKKMIAIEPIMEFNLDVMVGYIKRINPFQVNIGADSGHNNLPEPSKEKTLELISELKKFTSVHLKSTLDRLLK